MSRHLPPSHRHSAGARPQGAYAAIARSNQANAQLNATRRELLAQREDNKALKKQLEQLKKSASRDELTGLYNRKEAEELFKALCDSTCRDKVNKVVVVTMIDIDFFKSVNDTYGHLVGDKVLKAVADTIKKQSRASDFAIRWGGEEMCVLYACETSGTGAEHAERLRSAIESMDLTSLGCPKVVTASIGVHFLNPKDLHESCSLIKEMETADELLYHSKEAGGRNCISIKSPEGKVTVYSKGQAPVPASALESAAPLAPKPPIKALSKFGAFSRRTPAKNI